MRSDWPGPDCRIILAAMVLSLCVSCAPSRVQDTRHLPVHLFVPADGTWLQEEVQAYLNLARQAFASCRIEINSDQSTLLQPITSGRLITPVESFNLLGERREKDKVSVIFVDRLVRSREEPVSLGGAAVTADGITHVAIARRTAGGDTLQPAQTLAHELGHVLGLAHDERQPGLFSPGNLMRPAPCMTCAFTQSQCHTMRQVIGRQ